MPWELSMGSCSGSDICLLVSIKIKWCAKEKKGRTLIFFLSFHPACKMQDQGKLRNWCPRKLKYNFKTSCERSAWGAQSVKHMTLDFGSGHGLVVPFVSLSPVSGFCWQCGVCLGFSLSLSVSLSLSLPLSLSSLFCLSRKINK